MFSIAHLVIIFVVALVVFGPEKLPDLARNLGKVMGEFRRATGDLRSTFEGHMRDLEREAELRKVRGAESAGQASGLVAGVPADQTIGGGDPGVLPLSTTETSDAAYHSDGAKDSSPPAGTIESERPNAVPFETDSPQQLRFEPQELHPGERPDSDPEKVSDGSPSRT